MRLRPSSHTRNVTLIDCHRQRRNHDAHHQWQFFSSIPQRHQNEADGTRHDADDHEPPNAHFDEESIAFLTRLKEQRRQNHTEKYEMARRKRELARRKVLAEEWMRIFASSDDLFRATLRELKVDKGEWSNDGRSYHGAENESALSEYRSFYLDSLPSFGVALSEEDTESNITTAAFKAMERFAQSAFADPVFSKKFRAMNASLKKKEELYVELGNAKEAYSRALRDLAEEEKVLNAMESGHKSGNRANSSADQFRLTSKNRGDYGELDRIEQEVNASLSQVSIMKSDQKKLAKQKNRVSAARGLFKRTTKRVERIQADIKDTEFPLSQD
jgi:hypothetical protein